MVHRMSVCTAIMFFVLGGGGQSIYNKLYMYIHTYRIVEGNSFIANQIGQRSTDDDRNKLTPSVLRVKVTLDG
jgi:hypothetical protein